ncbi:unnamed protein product [Rotaria socialis]|uniref:Smr domain-containing protein n=1 Tax=Rotaria socialis TaxID=392032 RepID=A0A820QE10_9BILA|nr:unnamed protein product [Rotaria socialis]CAF3370190.1 unnamed protein product [Rotaria socialis]CAF3399473.1 unnamed protein product [Rotaria socialis]CAF3559098.1 unnamed protein product [Rotaria socialis]CAF3651768.1 unnamed protein product [Rotaria socialis]
MGSTFSSTTDDHHSTFYATSVSSSVKSDIPFEAESLRREAHQCKSEAEAASRQSQHEYHSGRKSEAKALSNQKKDLYSQMDEKNEQAAALIFQHFNQNLPEHFIDLHGLYVFEALKYLQQKLNECRSSSISRLTVITGMGNHSPHKMAKINPEVENFAHRNNLKIIPGRGRVEIRLDTDDQYEKVDYQDSDGCIIL